MEKRVIWRDRPVDDGCTELFLWSDSFVIESDYNHSLPSLQRRIPYVRKKSKKKTGGLGGFRPGSGRKPMGDEPVKSHAFSCTDAQWERWKSVAKAEGKSLSEWIRENLDRLADDAGM